MSAGHFDALVAQGAAGAGGVLIAGCGYVGSALAARLIAEGRDDPARGEPRTVWGLRRRPQGLPAGVRPLAADLGDRGSLDRALDEVRREGAPLAAVVYAVSADGPSEAAYRAAYVEGLERLLEALRSAGLSPGRILFTSSTSVYAQQDGSWVDEDSPTEPEHFSGRLVLEGEALLAAGPFPGAALRLGGIYGPGRTRLLESVLAGEARLPAEGPRWTNRIHRDDAAGALAHLLALPQLAPLYVGVDREPADRAEVLRWLARELGAPEPPAGAPGSATGRAARSNKRCSSVRLQASGYTFAYPSFREGYAPLVAERLAGSRGG